MRTSNRALAIGCLLAWTGLAVLAWPAVAADVSLRGVHTSTDGDATRVVIDLSEMTRYQYGVLPADARTGKPPRVYVDVHEVVLGAQDGTAVAVSDPRVTRIRTGQHTDRVARIVVEVQGKLTPKILTLEMPPRIVIELTGPGITDRAVTSAQGSGNPASTEAPAQSTQQASAAGSARTGGGGGKTATPVSPSALARLQGADGERGVVTLKGASGAEAATPSGARGSAQPQAAARLTPARPTEIESPARSAPAAGVSRAAPSNVQAQMKPGTSGGSAPMVAGRGTALEPLAGSPAARVAATTQSSASGLASAAPTPRAPLNPGRGTDLLPLPPLPAGVQAARPVSGDPPKAKRVRVVLDPGHGGKDPGAQGPGVTEKASVLDIALRVAAKLNKNLGVEVHLTRSDDTYVSLAQRKDLANRMEADLFVSIHANASRNSELFGIETYYLKNSNDRATLRLARLENGVDMLIKGSDVSTDADLNYILSDIIQGQKESDSVLLANHIQNQLCSNLEKRYDSIHSLGVKQGPFLVLDGTYMPAVLVEAGFVTNYDEARRLGASAYRESVAEGIYRGIKAYLEDDRVNDLT